MPQMERPDEANRILVEYLNDLNKQSGGIYVVYAL